MPLKKVCSVRNLGASEKIEKNLISFFDYGFVDKGGYFNIAIGQTGDYVSNLSSLTKVQDSRGFTYWAGPKNWVYESGADSSGVNAPPQIYVNGSLYSSGTVNYKEGAVYNIPANATGVTAQFSYKWVTFISARESNYGKKITIGDNRTDLNTISRATSAELSISLPFVSFDVPSISSSKEYGLGAEYTPMVNDYNIRATIVGENDADVKRICDIIVAQQGFAINTFDPETVLASGDVPVTMWGAKNSGKTHDELASLYPWVDLFLEKIKANIIKDFGNGLYQSTIDIKLKHISCDC